jgi:flagellar basal body L-ring protein FlgH
MKISILFVLFFLASCANYVNNVHKQIDREDKMARKDKVNHSPSPEYWRNRFHPEKDKRPVQNPITYSLGSGPSGQAVPPPVRRDYRPQRYNANDFRDTGNDGSLWANQGSSASLFTYQNDKKEGDIVIINVMENLRNQISAELTRSFPDKPKKKIDGDDKKKDPKAAAAPAPVQPNKDDQEMDMKVYDKISGTVLEEISQDYILVRGQKEVIFKKEKRSIEVQALVSRKDILENDYVNSDKLLESRVFILRDRQ